MPREETLESAYGGGKKIGEKGKKWAGWAATLVNKSSQKLIANYHQASVKY